MAFETDMLACAAEEDRRQHASTARDREVNRVTNVTLAMAYAGDYERFRDVLDYGDMDQRVFGALESRSLGYAHWPELSCAIFQPKQAVDSLAINSAE